MSLLTTEDISSFLYATSNFLALPLEKRFNPEPFVEWAASHWNFVFGLCIAYLLTIFGGRHLMKCRESFDLQLPLAAWNGLLCVFSFIGMCRTVPTLIANVLTKSYGYTVCANPGMEGAWGSGPTGMWVMLFIFSKIPELVDTIFIVLRKKPLIFLHWYHHVTVLLFCWSSYATIAGSGLYFVAMNYTVHAMMYGYYCLQALKLCPKSFPAHLITISQIAQMFVGTFVCLSSWYFKLSGVTCSNDMTNLIAGALMYGSYLFLFCQFALSRYGSKKSSTTKKLQ